MDMSHVRAARNLKQPVKAIASAEAPILDAPTGLRDPRKIMGQRLGLVSTWCGPWVMMALTGRPLEEVRAGINERRGREVTAAVKGTYHGEVLRVLNRFGWGYSPVPPFAYNGGDGRKTVSFAAALRNRTSEQMQEVWLVSAGKHWHLVKGRKVTCSIVQRWTWISHASKRRAPVKAIYRLTKLDDANERRAETVAKLSKAVKQQVDASKRRAAERVSAKKATMAEAKRLGCRVESGGRGNDLFIEVHAPEGMVWSNGTHTQTAYDWKEAFHLIRDERVEDFLPDPEAE